MPITTRSRIHELLNDALDELGHPEEKVMVKWGTIVIEMQFQNGQPSLVVTERKSVRPLKGA